MPTLPQALAPVWLWLLVACLPSILGSAAPAMAAARSSSALERAAQLATRLEAAEAQTPSMEQEDVMQTALLYAVQDLSHYLERHPREVRAFVVMARLIRLQQAFDHVYGEAGRSEVEPGTVQRQLHTHMERLTHAHTLLDRALTLAPGNAEAHYWKARLYGMTQPTRGDGQVSFTSSLDEAIRHARRAVVLAPQHRPYKEHLAVSLVAAQQYDAAIAILRDVDGGRHLLARLLADFQAIPLPDDAIPWPQDNVMFAQLGMAGTSYPLARVRTYLIPHSAAHVEAFYRRHWPGFSWFRQGQDPVFTQFLRLQRGVFRPTVRGLESIPEHPASGLLLSLLESDEPTPSDGSHFPFPVGQTYCRLWLLNYRMALMP